MTQQTSSNPIGDQGLDAPMIDAEYTLFLAVNQIAMEAIAKFIDELPSKIFHSYVKLQFLYGDSVVY